MNPRSGSIYGSEASFEGVLTNKIVLNKNTEDQLECIGYKDNTCKKVLFYFLVFITFGLILLLFHWHPKYEIYLKKSQCPLVQADCVLLKDSFNHAFVENIKVFYLEKGCSVDLYHGEPIYPENTQETDEVASLVTPQTCHFTVQEEWLIKYFDHQHVRYIWDSKVSSFKKLEDLSTNIYCRSLLEDFHGMSWELQKQKHEIYGPNNINVEVKSYWKLLIYEVLNPFYIFQIASIILWASDQYYYYAACIFLISCISIAISLYETHKQSVTLHDMVASGHEKITVRRSEERYEEVSTDMLVPGDVIIIPSNGCILQCDAILIAGTCIVNESMLTGESVPVTKTQLSGHDDEIYSPVVHKKYTLFAGTQVLQTRYYGQAKVLAVVVRTGFNTAKGELVRAILFPKPLGFKFYKDSIKFILLLCILAGCGMIYSIYIYIRKHFSVGTIFLRALDIITIVVPPALPAAMTVGTVYAQNRLKKQGIFCISPPRINFCGKLNLICFDKTGTLTEDGLDLWAVIPNEKEHFKTPVYDPTQLPNSPLTICMATCHSLTMIEGELSGDPLDLKMFLSINWVIQEPGRDTHKFDNFMPTVVNPCTKDTFTNLDQTPFEVGIVRQFTFSSTLQRMSVIARTLGKSHMDVYSKGAPEKIASLCLPDTIPPDFADVLHKYTIQGFRVLALAWKECDSKLTWHQAQRINRDKVECDLKFLGLLVMKNTLKPETAPIIKTLQAANIRSVMVTGDMILTAISVARNCGMVKTYEKVIIVDAQPPENGSPARIQWEQSESVTDESPTDSDQENCPLLTFNETQEQGYHSIRIEPDYNKYHFAVSGKSFSVLRNHFPEIIDQVCQRGTIFARMSPEQKAQLVEKFQELEYGTGFCGDGANDCEALKAAHAGISLSETEASVAAPFTSRKQNIECVVTVIREGRAALVTSFGCFKYMALYSLIQFCSVLILYTFLVNLADFQYLYVDLVITTSVAVLMGYTKAHDKLTIKKPPGSLVKLTNIISICMQVTLVITFQAASFFYLQKQPWYHVVQVNSGNESVVQCHETTLIFLVSSFQYITVAFAFSKGPPHRKRFYTNVPFTIVTLLLVGFSLLLLIHPFKLLISFFQMKAFPNENFKNMLIVIIFVYVICCLFVEFLIVDLNVISRVRKWISKHPRMKKYKKLEKDLQDQFDWPPIGCTTYASDIVPASENSTPMTTEPSTVNHQPR